MFIKQKQNQNQKTASPVVVARQTVKEIFTLPRSEQTINFIHNLTEGHETVYCRMCEKEIEQQKTLDHWYRHFDPVHEPIMSISEIKRLVVPVVVEVPAKKKVRKEVKK